LVTVGKTHPKLARPGSALKRLEVMPCAWNFMHGDSSGCAAFICGQLFLMV
jgi:hypothetical protein